MFENSKFKSGFWIIAVLLSIHTNSAVGHVEVLTSDNFDNLKGEYELIIINFYADWCRFSNQLAPIWESFGQKVKEKYGDSKKVLVGKVDSVAENDLSARYSISKYPTLKIIRNGEVVKREYRGQRSADALFAFVEGQLTDPIQEITSLQQIEDIKSEKRRSILGYFETLEGIEYENFKKVASSLKDDCKFYVGSGDTVRKMRPGEDELVTFSGEGADEDDTFTGRATEHTELLVWATDRCVPLVRTITFENAEELTEEGLPFFLLFHRSDDSETPAKFRQVVENSLRDYKTKLNFLIADGGKFSHPLHHVGKSQDDLPLLAIDSFRHIYLYKDRKNKDLVDGTITQMALENPQKMKKFIKDMQSGKLHREYHFGEEDDDAEDTDEDDSNNNNGDQNDGEVKNGESTSAPESAFAKLKPNQNRYSMLNNIKEEL